MNQKYVAAIFDRKGVASRKGRGKVKLEFTSTEMYVTLLAKQPELVGIREKNNFVLGIKVFSAAFIIIFKP